MQARKLSVPQKALLFAARHAWNMVKALEVGWPVDQESLHFWKGKRSAHLEALYLFRGASK